MNCARERGDSDDDADEMDCSHRLFACAGITPFESVRVFRIGIFRSTGTASRRINQRPALLGPSRFGHDPVGCEFLLSRSPLRVDKSVLHLAGRPPKSYFMLVHDRDTIRDATRSGRGVRAAQHRARVTVTADRHDLSISHVNMLGERNGAEDCVNIYDGDAVLAIDNKPDYVDALHD